MAESSEEKKLSLKIMVDVKAKKVVFAEADKEFVDFIFSLMSLPLSTITKVLLLNEKGMVGSVGTLYKSIESLNTQCFKHQIDSDSVLKPRAPVTIPLLSLHDLSAFTYVAPKKTAAEYVNGGTLYMVTDNLEVKPMSIVFIKSHVKDFDVLEEKQVQVGLQEGLDILKASLETNSVLTTVFLNKI